MNKHVALLRALQQTNQYEAIRVIEAYEREVEILRELIVYCCPDQRPFGISDGQWVRVESLKLRAQRKTK
jgi:hypothetical protein